MNILTRRGGSSCQEVGKLSEWLAPLAKQVYLASKAKRV